MAITKATASSIAPAAKGNLVVGSATNDAAVLAVGTNNYVLTADSAETTGLKWAAASSGGMTLLSTTNLSGTTTTVSSISQDYTNLFIVVQNPFLNITSSLRLKPNGGNSGSNVNINQTSVFSSFSNIMDSINDLPTSTFPTYVSYVAQINNYTDTTFGKTYSFFGSNQSSTGGIATFGTIQTASAITSLDVTTANGTRTFSGGRVLIYGVK